jgi:hypothetical protein
MKYARLLAAVAILGSAQFVLGTGSDTLWLMNSPDASSWEVGWVCEAWNGTAWCGDTVDTVTDSIVSCSTFDFITDTGGITDTVLFKSYINYRYKFRDFWAQFGFTWSNWAGIDASEYKYLMMSYKGPLSVHQIKMSFYYGYTFKPVDSTEPTKDSLKLGDGLGILTASPSEWKTIVFEIPDSCDRVGITGIAFAFANAPNSGAPATSDVGTFKLDNVALLKTAVIPVRYTVSPRMTQSDRFHFVPKTTGKVALSVYSLRGELLSSRAISVEANRQYTVRDFALRNSGLASPQVRMAKITGLGVNVNEKIW